MPEAPNKKLQKLLVKLIEKPELLKQLKIDPKTFISKSALSATHKKILLGGNAEKIKATVAKAVGAEHQAGPIVIEFQGAKPMKLKGLTSSKQMFFHIVFGSEQTKVKVFLKKKDAALHVIHIIAKAIHITSKASDKS